ncbi:hypothetical protein P167DRAFT_306295 [Morchella conica CCBAS932]|uniref:Uncharacterized protein n=1 Tax=Morchella conica CCBAS932 TaxID=1392247 RepID=A0A3N4KMC5_9PEZI|nr:hypothetical protein P167DRAFT_306295 [Morchella conica CCBAS932]
MVTKSIFICGNTCLESQIFYDFPNIFHLYLGGIWILFIASPAINLHTRKAPSIHGTGGTYPNTLKGKKQDKRPHRLSPYRNCNMAFNHSLVQMFDFNECGTTLYGT